MFLHLGSNVSISSRDIIAIFDLTSTHSTDTRSFLQTAKDEGFLVEPVEGEAKSFVLTANRIYLSPIASLTLRKRLSSLETLDDEEQA
ncbi:MAG: extracellular matrix regulator RemB [Bacillota bacterium]